MVSTGTGQAQRTSMSGSPVVATPAAHEELLRSREVAHLTASSRTGFGVEHYGVALSAVRTEPC